MTRLGKKQLGAIAIALSVLAALLALVALPVTEADAAPGPIPDSFTAVATGGGLSLGFNSAQPFALPLGHPAREAECENGEDDETIDRISGSSIVPAPDGAIDFPADAQCSSLKDNSELIASSSANNAGTGRVPPGGAVNPQPKQSLTVVGTRNPGTGAIATTQRTFPNGYLSTGQLNAAGLGVNVQYNVRATFNVTNVTGTANADGSANLVLTGTVVAALGRVSCSGTLCFAVPQTATCTTPTATITMTTETSGSLTGERYDTHTKTAVLVAEGFAIGEATGNDLACPAMNDTVGLPTTGDTRATIPLSFADVTGCAETAYTAPGAYLTGADCWEPHVEVSSSPASPVAPGTPVTLDGSLSYDPGYDDNLTNLQTLTTWQWNQISGPAVTLSGGDPKVQGFTPTTPGTYEFQLTGTGNPHYPDPASSIVTVVVEDEEPECSLSGTVTDDQTTNPISGVQVAYYADDGTPGRIAQDVTDGSGNYDFGIVDCDTYRLKAWDNSDAYVTEWFDNATNYFDADSVALVDGANDVDIELTSAGLTTGKIDGVVRNNGGQKLGGVKVGLYNSGGQIASTTTGAAGYYEFPFVEAADCACFVKYSGSSIVAEWWEDAPNYFSSTALPLSPGGHLTQNATVTENTESGTISVNTQLQAGGAAANVDARLYTASGFIKKVTTNGSGNATLTDVAPGTYYIRFVNGGISPEWWQNAGPNFDDCTGIPACTPTTIFATPIVVGPGANVPINAVVSP